MFGGVLTLIFRIVVTLYIGFQIKDIINKKNTIKTRTTHNNLAIDNQKWNLTSQDFDIAWRFSSRELLSSEPEFFNNTELYFDVQLYIVSWERIDELGDGRVKLLNRTLTPAKLIPCTSDRFNN